MSNTLTSNLRSRRNQLIESFEQGFSSSDIQSVNILAHARRHWPVQFTWTYLLERLTVIQGDTITVPELWELRMITDAGQHPDFNPLACHPWSGYNQPHPADRTLQRLSRVFAGCCARLMIDRGSAVTRQYYIRRLRAVLVRVTNLCNAAQQEYDDNCL
jgi:hypothetical protein